MRKSLPGIAAALLVAFALDTYAASQRTFVRSDGTDAGNLVCSLANPCRSFNTAIANTISGGEVVILDTAGYGAMTINKAIKIIGPSGIYGGISVSSLDGVTINAGDADVVTLRGLDIAGLGGVNGVTIVNAAAVHIEKSSISNFTLDTSACIRLDSAKPIRLYVDDSFLRECRFGLRVNGSDSNAANRPTVHFDNVHLERMLNTQASGSSGINATGNVGVHVKNSVISNTGDGIFVSSSLTGPLTRVSLFNVSISHSGGAAIETGGSAGGNVVVNVVSSVFHQNTSVLLHAFGTVELASSVITTNTNSLVNCGSGSVNSLGNNLITSNTDSALPAGCASYITPTNLGGK